MTTNVMLRDLDLFLPRGVDGRRLEVVADGLPLFDGAQLAVDTTLVSPLHCDGSARLPPMGLPSVQQDEERRERALNLLAPIVVLVWSSWQVRWEDGGQKRPGLSSPSWPRRSPGRSRWFCAAEWNKLGGSGGAQCCLVRQQGRLLHRS